MQLAYFENSNYLPKEVFKQHYQNVMLQAEREPKELITFKEWKEQILSCINEIIDTKEEIVYKINTILWKESDLHDLSQAEKVLYGKILLRNDALKTEKLPEKN